jgi:hypothetical protein
MPSFEMLRFVLDANTALGLVLAIGLFTHVVNDIIFGGNSIQPRGDPEGVTETEMEKVPTTVQKQDE